MSSAVTMDVSTWPRCQCDTCKADGNEPKRVEVGYDFHHFCTAHPDFVQICEWGEELSGEECKQLSEAVAAGLVKRGQLAWEQERSTAFCKACEEQGSPCDWDSFVENYGPRP